MEVAAEVVHHSHTFSADVAAAAAVVRARASRTQTIGSLWVEAEEANQSSQRGVRAEAVGVVVVDKTHRIVIETVVGRAEGDMTPGAEGLGENTGVAVEILKSRQAAEHTVVVAVVVGTCTSMAAAEVVVAVVGRSQG